MIHRAISHVLLFVATLAMTVACDDVDSGRPEVPESEKVTRPVEIDADKETLKGRTPPPPHHDDTATTQGANAPTTNP